MTRLLLASVFAALPFSVHAADIYNDNVEYNFIQDNAPEQSAVVGHLSLGGGWVNEEFVGFSTNTGGLFTAAGRANVNFYWLNVQLETNGFVNINDGGSSRTSFSVAGHVWGRTNNFALGVYGAVDFDLIPYNVYTVGGEVEAYLGPVTIGADIDYNWFEFSGSNFDYWTTRGWVDFYVTPNTRIGAEIYYGEVLAFDTWSGVVDAEHRFAGTRVGAWIEGRYYHQEWVGSDMDTWSGMIGLRVFMDAAGTTLHEHDKAVPWQFKDYPFGLGPQYRLVFR